MPYAANKQCRKYGCPKYQVRDGYCDDHQELAIRVDRRPAASERGYDANWTKFSRSFLRANPVCAMCGYEAEVTHHKQPLREGGRKWDRDNLQALCWECHERVHGRVR